MRTLRYDGPGGALHFRFAALAAALIAAASPLDAEWVLSAFLGGLSTQNAPLHITQPGLGTDIQFHDVRYTSRSFDFPLYYGYRASYFFNRYAGIETEFVHAKAFAEVHEPVDAAGTIQGQKIAGRVPPDRILDRFELSHGLNFLFANFVGRREFMKPPGRGRGPITIVGRIGVGPTIPHVEATGGAGSVNEYQLGSVAFHAAAGVELNIWRNINAILEYKYTRTNENVTIPAGHADTLLRSHHGILGIAYHF